MQIPDGLSAEQLRRSLEGIPSTLQGELTNARIRPAWKLQTLGGCVTKQAGRDFPACLLVEPRWRLIDAALVKP